ncbi:MAG: HD-GYP domain-containing protein [Armatimonadota bacterium]|nr:HD-GYP domain-containing protein [Armatimonadota bacterium]
MSSSRKGRRSKRFLRLGSRLLEDAYTQDGTLLLRAGARITTLTELARLSQPDVRFGKNLAAEIPIDMENEAVLDAEAMDPDPEVTEFLKGVERAREVKHESISNVESMFAAVEAGEVVDLELARRTVSRLLEELLGDPRALVSLTQLKNADAYTYTHSVHVCVLAIHLALHTDFRDQVEEIGLGALLHDIGKIRVPLHILNKQGPLTPDEMKQMKLHPVFGVEQLKKSGETRPTVLSCVLHHHEKVSGRGYPDGKRGRHISPFAMMTSIADIYDALTTDRPYRAAMDPKEAILMMAKQMAEDLHEGLLQSFVSLVGYYPVGSEVQLSNGFRARVLRHYASKPNEPRVVLTADAEGRPIPGLPVIEMSKECGVSIVGFVRGEGGFSVARDLAGGVRKAA